MCSRIEPLSSSEEETDSLPPPFLLDTAQSHRHMSVWVFLTRNWGHHLPYLSAFPPNVSESKGGVFNSPVRLLWLTQLAPDLEGRGFSSSGSIGPAFGRDVRLLRLEEAEVGTRHVVFPWLSPDSARDKSYSCFFSHSCTQGGPGSLLHGCSLPS